MFKKSLAVATIAKGTAFPAAPAQANDWACEFLLCLMSQNPNWQGIPSCHPPMTRLMSAIEGWFFTWPICDGANATTPLRADYEGCPPGHPPVALSDLSPGAYSVAQKSDAPRYFGTTNSGGSKTRHTFSLAR